MKAAVKILLPKDVQTIINRIEKEGFEAYAVGGCVRDSLLGRKPDDWDITTSARPEQIKEIFPRTIDTGIQHGTVTVMMHHVGYEVTTYRIDGEYADARHPKEVTFTAELTEDLRRRDFTVNAMAYNDRCGIIDVFGGRKDLQEGIIRAVGNAGERFGEDALRIMRAVRFSAQLGYRIEEETRAAVASFAGNLKHISAERIQTELVKLLQSPHPGQLRELYLTGITGIIMPEFDRIMETEQNNPHHRFSVGEHTIAAVEAVEADKILRLAMLFHDFGKADCKTTDEKGIDHFHGHSAISERLCRQIMRRLKFDNDTMRMVERLVRYHDYDIIPEEKYVRRAVSRIGGDAFPLLLKVKQADLDAQSDYCREEKQRQLDETGALYREILQKQQCVSLKTLAVDGSDLIAWGMKPGREVGQMLALLLDRVLEDPNMNDKQRLKEIFLASGGKK